VKRTDVGPRHNSSGVEQLGSSFLKNLSTLWLVFLAAASLRLAIGTALWDQPLRIVDEQHYHQLARGIAERGEFAFKPGRPTAMRPPLYPAFLAGFFRLGLGHPAVRAVQAALALVTGLLLWRLGRRWWGKGAAAAGTAVFLLYPTLVFFNFLILTETLFIFLLLLALWMLERGVRSGGPVWCSSAGVVWALAGLTRSIAYPVGLLLGLATVWLSRRHGLKALVLGAAFVVCFAVTLSPWAYRNYRVFGQVVPVGTMGGLNLYMGNYEHTPLHRAWAAVEVWNSGKPGHLPPGNEAQRQKAAVNQALAYMKAHVLQTALRSMVKLANFWGLERTVVAGMEKGYFSRFSCPVAITIAAVFILGACILVTFCGLVGFVWRFLWARAPMDWVAAVMFVGFSGLHALVFGHPRYRLPLVPLLCGYAAWAWFQRRDMLSGRGNGPRWVAAVVGLFLCVVWGYDVLIGSRGKVLELLRMLG